MGASGGGPDAGLEWLLALCEAEARDRPVDTSGIAPLDDAFRQATRHDPFFRPMQEQVAVHPDAHLDTDVLAGPRAEGRGQQTCFGPGRGPGM